MESIVSALEACAVLEPQSFANLQLFPLVLAEDRGAPYSVLDDALATGAFLLTEVSESASVGDLRAQNRGDRPVLLVDGEEVVGAKQNRVFNISILVPAGATVIIPVSCVEHGRWRHESSSFSSADHAEYPSAREARNRQVSDSLRHEGRARSNQGEVWREIQSKAARMEAGSETGAMRAIYERHRGRIEDYTAAFRALPLQAGAVFSIGGQPAGLELFDAPATFARVLPKLVRSYALDAMEGAPVSPPPADWLVRNFLSRVGQAGVERFPTVGAGEMLRLSGAGITGSALLEAERIVHLAAFASRVG
ncbi:MAG: hypothetical protein HY875_04035 [Chloroflexi bacterium]|nr:hypothetical protein [Chloroflexota bacterium]